MNLKQKKNCKVFNFKPSLFNDDQFYQKPILIATPHRSAFLIEVLDSINFGQWTSVDFGQQIGFKWNDKQFIMLW